MSLVVSIAVTVSEDDTTYVAVQRAESVLPVSPNGAQTDLVDLARATLTRLHAEAAEIADGQVVALRELLEDAA